MSADKIQNLVDKTYTLSKDYNHQYVTLEHLLAIILDRITQKLVSSK